MILRQRERGLTLIELLVVLALMALIFTMANSMMSTYRQSRLNKLRDDFVGTLEKARLLSMTSMPHGVRCTGTTFSLVTIQDGSCSNNGSVRCSRDSDCGAGNVCLPGDYVVNTGESPIELESRNVPQGITLCCLPSCANYTIWFDRKGIPRDASWGLGMTTVSLGVEGSQSVSITISAAGRIQYER